MEAWKRRLKGQWTYLAGALILAALNILLFARTGKPWKVTTGFLYWGAGFLEWLGADPRAWAYFQAPGQAAPASFFWNSYTVSNVAIVLGAALAALMNSEFKWKRIKNRKQLAFGLLGGILMGFGTRLSYGCNIGSYFSAIPSFSLHGWVYAVSMFAGAYIGSKLLMKYLI